MINEKAIKRYPLSQQVADQLEAMIEEGVYKVGERIPTEPVLTQMFNVSRNTLREAVQSLAAAGILTVRQGDGTYVRSNNRFHAHMNKEYSKVSSEDVREARNVLEITIARLAAARRTEEDLRDIEEKLHQRQRLEQSERENTLADIQFHRAIAKATHNKILDDLYGSITSYMEGHIAARQAQTHYSPQQIDRLHEDLFLAIQKQDPERAGASAQNILKI